MLRIESVDSFRVAAIIAVIAIHTVPFGYGRLVGYDLDPTLIVNQAARFAVPFFLVISGYFWSAKINAGADILRISIESARRVGLIFIFWSCVFLLIGAARSFVNGGPALLIRDIHYVLSTIADKPLTSLLQGGKPHLWFLTSLLLSILISAFFLSKRQSRLLIILSATLYVLGLLGGAYQDAPLGIDIDFDFRNGPFFALVCFVGGHLLYRIGRDRCWLRYGALLTLVGLTGQFGELIFLNSTFGTTMWQDYVGSTLLLGLGVAMMALSNHPALRLRGVARLGPFVLGIYAVHYFFVDLFRNRHGFSAIPWLDELLYVVLVFLLSVGSVVAMSRFKYTKNMVT